MEPHLRRRVQVQKSAVELFLEASLRFFTFLKERRMEEELVILERFCCAMERLLGRHIAREDKRGNKKSSCSEYIFQKWHLLNNFVQIPYCVIYAGTMMQR